jgi:hypothetical protein
MSSEQRTARETLEQAFHEMADEWIRQADDIRLRRGQMTREKRGHEMLASCAYAIQDKIAALRAAPAPEPEHVCGGCGYKWNWPVPSPIELCGDCWRKTWPVLRGAAPAPEGETWHPRATAPETGVAFRAYGPALVDLDFNPLGQVEACWDADRFIGAAWNGQSDIWNTLPIEFTHWQPMPPSPDQAAPASPGPTPEGRETNWLASALAEAKATAANILTPEQVQALRDSHEQAIRAAQAETLREVRAKLGQWLDQGHSFTCPVYDGAPCTCGLSAALSALTVGTEETK